VPGVYTFTVTLDGASQAVEARVLADPRIDTSLAGRQANQALQLELQGLRAKINGALERIITARRDLQTIDTLIDQSGDPQAHVALEESVTRGMERLRELESAFRVPEDSKGRPYSGDKAINVLRRANAFLTSSYEAPSPTAKAFAARAEQRIADAVDSLNAYLEGDFASIRSALADSGLTLLGQEPLSM